MREILIALLLLGGPLLVAAPSTTATSVTVTLRVAPTFADEADPSTGYVIPSEHWTANAAQNIAEQYTGPHPVEATTPAVWLRDPGDFAGQPGVAGCEVHTGGNPVTGEDVLDQAKEDGCISDWEMTPDGFVTMVDGLWKSNATSTGWPVAWWQIQKNLHIADNGIEQVTLEDGDSLGLVRHRS